MNMEKREYPILEFDTAKEAIIEPDKVHKTRNLSEYCVPCFFQDVIGKLKEEGELELKTNMKSEMGLLPIYEINYRGQKINVYHPGIGASFAAGTLEELIALGGRKFIACGGAGVLDKEIEVGHLIIPDSAVRDEGASYHYLPPSREVKAEQEVIDVISETFEEKQIEYTIGKTWSTAGLYRETAAKINLRKSEGCIAVEMETAAFLSVAKFRDVKFGQILYGGDDVSGIEWDSRDWANRKKIREKIFWLAVESCIKL